MAKRIEKPARTEPYVEVMQESSRLWSLRLRDPNDPWTIDYGYDIAYARTEQGACRKAERMLARWNRKYGNLSAGFTVQ